MSNEQKPVPPTNPALNPCPVVAFNGATCPACGVPRANHIAAREVTPDYITTVCGGCDRPKAKCCCSDGDCG